MNFPGPGILNTDGTRKKHSSPAKQLTAKKIYDIVDGRMEAIGLFFMRKNKGRTQKQKIRGGGSCAYKNHTGMYRM